MSLLQLPRGAREWRRSVFLYYPFLPSVSGIWKVEGSCTCSVDQVRIVEYSTLQYSLGAYEIVEIRYLRCGLDCVLHGVVRIMYSGHAQHLQYL